MEAESNLNEVRRLIHAAMAETRVMLFELRPAATESIPLGELLALLTESITSRSDVHFQLSLDNVPPLSPEVQTAFYRIAQEALNNVVKHSQASLVRVVLRARPGDPPPGLTIQLSVVDNGVGLNHSDNHRSTFGLQIMRERAAAIGAQLTILGERDAGTRVDLTWQGQPDGEHNGNNAPNPSHDRRRSRHGTQRYPGVSENK
jgi:signal transduction histidine kinase